MSESFQELRTLCDHFLTRGNFKDRIVAAVDDYQHAQRQTVAANSSGNSNHKSTAAALTSAAFTAPRVAFRMAEFRSFGGSSSNGDGSMLAQRLRFNPNPHIRALEAACHAIADEERPGYDKHGGRVKVAIQGPLGAAALSPRQLTAASLRQLVCVEGVATKVSTIKPKVVQSVHFCPTTQKHQKNDYVDATDPNLGLRKLDNRGEEMPDSIIQITSSVYPTRDKENKPLETEFGLSTYKDHQTITLQEMPEKAPMGQLPRSVELILDHDLVDRIKPGDRVAVVGVHRALATASQGQQSSSGHFRTVVLVNSIQILGRGGGHLNFESRDVRAIRELSQHKSILDILGRSIAPSIHGHANIKKAIVLQQLSGVEKNLENGTHLRGDINILMVGDPSTAKSQLLRSAMIIAPLAVSTTGKGSSGVGLTAAVTTDPDTRERRLEAGAMILADRGLVCVDEFDKMGENDRVAIHEAMEQQTVTIAKAGIHASLNARCSVLAAANPVYGRYDRRRRVQENIGLPDSLLSRFDLLFVILDQIDPEQDRRIASHVVRGHRYRLGHGNPCEAHESDGEDGDDDDDDDDNGGGDQGARNRQHLIWQRQRQDSSSNDETVGDPQRHLNDPHANDILQHDFLRKYLRFAKARMQPSLSESAREFIAARYTEMRARQDDRTLPVTARSLETVIRLATAHAKARLSPVIEAEPDCGVAMDLLSFALYHEPNHDVVNSDNANLIMSTRTVPDDKPLVSDEDDEIDNSTHNNDFDNSDKHPQADRDDASDMSPSRKRPRVLSPEAEALKARIWESLTKHDGELSLRDDDNNDNDDNQNDTDIATSILASLATDREQLVTVLQVMEQEGRILVSDGMIYQT